MGGQVSVKSEVNVGSTFSITIATKIKIHDTNINHTKK